MFRHLFDTMFFYDQPVKSGNTDPSKHFKLDWNLFVMTDWFVLLDVVPVIYDQFGAAVTLEQPLYPQQWILETVSFMTKFDCLPDNISLGRLNSSSYILAAC